MVPRTVLTRSGPISLNAARPVNTVQPRTALNNAGHMKNVINNAYSTARRPFNIITAANNNNFNKRVNIVNDKNVNAVRPRAVVNTARPKAVLSAVMGNKGNVVKASACWVWKPKHKVLDHVSRNNGASMSFKRFDYGNPQQDLKDKGVIDSGCSRHMTRNRCYLTDYEEINGGLVAFGGNSKGGKITRKDFMLTDKSHVLLKVTRKDNMYSVDLKNVVSQGGLIYLFAKATPDESNLWHMRLGHVNFKTMNKLVKGNLVRGLPLNFLKLIKLVLLVRRESNTELLMYCLVVTDDFSRFSWVFFLATKDETSKILKTFITGIENLIDLKVKVIRCDNGTEFKNSVMNQFYEMKGIKREFSVARTPQQNGVAERKNRTLIEAARTMLADLKLPTTFWAEAVNTACYVQNRVLVIKPQNKTRYELFLGKFDGKADEGFFIGYSTNSKAFRVFNSRTRIIEENLHVQFSENTPNIAGSKARMETIPGKDCILLPLSIQEPPFSSSSKDYPDAGFKPSGEEEKNDAKDLGNESENPTEGKDSEVSSTEEPRINQEKDDNINITIPYQINSTNDINTASDGNSTNNVIVVSSTVNTVGSEVNDVDLKTSIELLNDPNMPELKDIVYSDDDEDVGAEADINNLDTHILVSPILTTRIHKDHLVEQIIGDIYSTPQTRRMTKIVTEQAMFSSEQQRINHKDFQNCLFACFLSQEEPKKVYGNKKDERGIVIKNKERLVSQGYTQEERIDYDEVFALVARIEAIRLFLAYASFKDFVVYQMDVKSDFLYGKIEEEVYVCQPLGFEDPDFPDRVYKVEKALYGLHQAPKA
ncbi:putative ribonuclease H-like domain-containing protein [Tanacetum coccineum]